MKTDIVHCDNMFDSEMPGVRTYHKGAVSEKYPIKLCGKSYGEDWKITIDETGRLFVPEGMTISEAVFVCCVIGSGIEYSKGFCDWSDAVIEKWLTP